MLLLALLTIAIVPLVCAMDGNTRPGEGQQVAALTSCPEGLEYVNGQCYLKSPKCPPGRELRADGLCYLLDQPQPRCPEGRELRADGLCYLINPVPCPFDSTTTTTTTTTTASPPISTPKEPLEGNTTTEDSIIIEETETEPSTTEDYKLIEKPATTEDSVAVEELTTQNDLELIEEQPTPPPPPSPEESPTAPPSDGSNETIDPVNPIDEPPIDNLVRCPPGSVFMNEQCRKLICTQGEYHAGRCLVPACPKGTVWRGKRCQEPGYITTILEIDNVITNRKDFEVASENVNNVEYITNSPYNPETDDTYQPPPLPSLAPPTPSLPFFPEINEEIIETTSTTTARSPGTITTTELITIDDDEDTEDSEPGVVPPDGCCTVKSPRICKFYHPRWVCFHRSQRMCDARICTRPLIYLKPPNTEYSSDPPLVVLPPNPPLMDCDTFGCNKSDVLDCSGCAQNLTESCTSGCYHYFCPSGMCEFMNSQDFCELHPGGFGCVANDGCVWNWCNKKCH